VSKGRTGSITRRRFLAGGALVAAGVVGGGYGRYAIGDEFEEHLAGVIGVPLATASAMTRAAQGRLGAAEWDLHCGAFVAASTWPGQWALPDSVRRKAIRSMVDRLIVDTGDGLGYAGLRDFPSGRTCAGLVLR
jgi:hypothetical protein